MTSTVYETETDEHMGRCDLVLFLLAKKANVPILGPRFLVKFPRMGKAIEVKYPTYARGLPLGLNIDTCIMHWHEPMCSLEVSLLQVTVISEYLLSDARQDWPVMAAL